MLPRRLRLVAGFFWPSEMPLGLRTFDLKKQKVGPLTSGGGQAFPYGVNPAQKKLSVSAILELGGRS